MGEVFKLEFVTNKEGVKFIDEPIGYDAVPFTLKQDSDNLGRDVFFGGDNNNPFEFSNLRNHYLDTLLFYYNTFGWESVVNLIIEKDGVDNIIGSLDFQFAETDGLKYFKCKVIQDSNQANLKRRSDINVDVFNDLDIDGNNITPLVTENVLIKSKPIFKKTIWETSDYWTHTGFRSSHARYQNAIINLKQQDVEDSLVLFNRRIVRNNIGNDLAPFKNFEVIRAKDNLLDVNFIFEDIYINYFIFGGSSLNDNVNTPSLGLRPSARIYVGNENNIAEISSTGVLLKFNSEFIANESVSRFDGFTGNADKYKISFDNISVNIGGVPRGSSVYVVFDLDRYSTITEWISGTLTANAKTTTYNTITPSIRLIDGVSQVVKSTSNLITDFPFANNGGEMYNQRIFNGNLLRNLKDRPFNISFKDIKSWLPEINGHYQIKDNDFVFFGLYEDFYKNKELINFTGVRFDTYTKSLNEKHAINEFGFEYEKFQSQKENETENTFDIAHGKTQWLVQNKNVENKKEVKIGFVRDAFYLDIERRKSLELSENTSTQDDDTIFILDTKESLNDIIFTETDFLQHTYDDVNLTLKLSNTGTFSFILIGIAVGEVFKIKGEDNNVGSFEVVTVTDRFLDLRPIMNTILSSNNGERLTTFEYIVSKKTAPFISWSDEDFTFIDGVNDPSNFANLKYTVKRNILRFYNNYLSSCNFFAKKPIKNTLYNNNGTLSTGYKGLNIVEKEEFTPSKAILTPFVHEVVVISDFITVINLINDIRKDSGFVRLEDSNGHFVKIYPKELTYINSGENGELTIIGEEKSEPISININVDSSIGFIIINNEYTMPKLTYRLEDNRIYIMDKFGKLLYNPVYWYKISINNNKYEMLSDLISGLNSLI